MKGSNLQAQPDSQQQPAGANANQTAAVKSFYNSMLTGPRPSAATTTAAGTTAVKPDTLTITNPLSLLHSLVIKLVNLVPLHLHRMLHHPEHLAIQRRRSSVAKNPKNY
jgi:hypothetical protein